MDMLQARAVFDEVVALPGEQRLAAIDRLCAGDLDLRAKVEDLLRQHDENATRSLASPPVKASGASSPMFEMVRSATLIAAPGSTATSLIGRRIGRYHIMAVLGQGGMGVVYEAQQEQPHRLVALKVISAGVMNAERLHRFQHEAEILGRLQHPGIAQIFEAGIVTTGDGAEDVPYFAMELIRGQPLTKFAEASRLSTRQRLELLVKICQAVQHAHQKGVIHRDLKPGNILVDESGQPKILDFGIARATDSDLQATTLQTDIGQLIGTVQYMSPEQAAGDPAQLDTRSDVYALGVIAYELLAGRLPYDLKKKLIHEAVRMIREDDPTPLSSVDRNLRGDVEILVGKALEKERDRRYQSAQEFASDIERYLKDEPIVARPPSTWYQASKFARRNKALVGGVAATFLALVAGLVASLILLQQTNEARKGEAEQTQIAKDNAKKAGEEAERAKKAEDAEKQRADELQRVSAFQARRLMELTPSDFGRRLLEEQRRQVELGLRDRWTEDNTGTMRRLAEGDIQSWVDDYVRLVQPANPTEVARTVLLESIITPAIQAADNEFNEQPKVQAMLLLTIGETLRSLGSPKEAMDPLNRALTIYESAEGPDSLDTLMAQEKLALVQLDAAMVDQAASHLIDVYESRKRLLGPSHEDTLNAEGNLGNLYRAQGLLEKAASQYSSAYEHCLNALGDRNRSTIAILHNLSSVQHALGRLPEAEKNARAVVEAMRSTMPDGSDLIAGLSTLGGILVDQERPNEAVAYYQEAHEISKKINGTMHEKTLFTLSDIGFALQAQNRYAEAEEFFRETLRLRREVLGEEDPATLLSYHNEGYVLNMLGRLDEADTHYKVALEGRRRLYGDNHLQTLATLELCAQLARDRGDLDDAMALLERMQAPLEQAYGRDHPRVGLCLFMMSDIRNRQGRKAEAEELARQVVECMNSSLGADHPQTIIVTSNLAHILREQGKFDEAISVFEEVVSRRRRSLGDHDDATLRSINALAMTMNSAHRFQAAAKLALEAFEANRDVHGLEHQDTLGSAQLLVQVYDAWHAADPGKGYDLKAAEWKAKLAEIQAATQPASQPAAQTSPDGVPASQPEPATSQP